MNNWARFKEKLTVWVIRFSTEARMKYWGLTNLSPPDARRVVGLLQARHILSHAPYADLVSPIFALRLLLVPVGLLRLLSLSRMSAECIASQP